MQNRTRALVLGIILLGFTLRMTPAIALAAVHNFAAVHALQIVQKPTDRAAVEQAIAWGKRALQLQPADSAARRLLGYLYLHDSQFERALDVLWNPTGHCTDALICLHRGQALHQLGRHTAALAIWRSVPDLDVYFAFQGIAMHEQGKIDEAHFHYGLSWKIRQSLTPQKVEMYLDLCRDHRHKKEMDSALTWCVRAVRSSSSYWTLVELGRTYYERHQYKSAERTLREAIINSPRQGSAYRWLGLTLYELGQSEEALEALRTGILLGPMDVWTHLDFGHILQLEGAYQRAACEYLKALGLTDQESLMLEIRQRLASLPITQEDTVRCKR